jgi:hypothetical protein
MATSHGSVDAKVGSSMSGGDSEDLLTSLAEHLQRRGRIGVSCRARRDALIVLQESPRPVRSHDRGPGSWVGSGSSYLLASGRPRPEGHCGQAGDPGGGVYQGRARMLGHASAKLTLDTYGSLTQRGTVP